MGPLGRQPQTRPGLAADLRRLGLRRGDTVLVHASMRAVGWVVGGAPEVVRALQDTVGGDGTIVVPTITGDNSDPRRWAAIRRGEPPEDWWPVIRRHLPPFDPATTPSNGMGRIAEAVRTWPASVRSAHPQASFAAVGRDAAHLMADHDMRCHYGARSPLARMAESGAKVLLLGVGYDVCTAFHLAEYSVPSRPLRDYECVIAEHGEARWFEYQDIDLDDSDFGRLGGALEASPAGAPVRVGCVGHACSRLLPMGAAVEFAATWIGEHRPG
jgi:aminoglycoside 3-N-acetyltransferase